MDQVPRYQAKTNKDAWLLPTNYEYESTFELNTIASFLRNFKSFINWWLKPFEKFYKGYLDNLLALKTLIKKKTR